MTLALQAGFWGLVSGSALILGVAAGYFAKIPEAFKEAHDFAGLITVTGFLAASLCRSWAGEALPTSIPELHCERLRAHSLGSCFPEVLASESRMPEATFTHPLFGAVRFRTKHPVWVRGDDITFLSGFDTSDITELVVPQLAAIPGANHGRLRFHKRAHAQLLTAFEDIERLGLLKHIKTCAGSLNFRLRKPTNGALSKKPSNHAFGIAIDLNSDDGSLGESVAPVAPVFQKLGFAWGKSFADPMHFEVARFMDHPRSVASAVETRLAGAPLAFDTINFGGEVMAPLGQIDAALKLSSSPSAGQRVRVKGAGGRAVIDVEPLGGGLGYARLTQLAGLAGLRMAFDNESKIADLSSIDLSPSLPDEPDTPLQPCSA